MKTPESSAIQPNFMEKGLDFKHIGFACVLMVGAHKLNDTSLSSVPAYSVSEELITLA